MEIPWPLWVLSRGTWREPRLYPAFTKPPDIWECTSTDLAYLLTRPAQSAAMLELTATTCSNALDSMYTRLTTSSIRTWSLGVKWSRSQTWGH
ncbi:hypothetical protein TNCV_4385501 [Trichonephila clavipes]|nr:hypothetical protein TNCV_4385501 [Trichonephila clavipes]